MRGTLLTLVSMPIVIYAQSWCPPGATWTYTHSNSWTHEGFARYQYIGDTLLAGSNAQIISMHGEGYDFPMQTSFNWDQGPYFTTVNGGLVNLWTGSVFDTLFNFNANVGDHWLMNVPDGSTPFVVISVTDTGSTVIDGIPLRYLVTALNGSGSDTIMERLGSLTHQLVPWSMWVADQLDGPLRCYGDMEIDDQLPWWTYGCESWLGTDEASMTPMSFPFPNPGSDHFTLTLPPASHNITLFDATGRMVLHQRTTDALPVTNTEALPAGLYRITVRDEQGGVTSGPWMKE